MSADHHATSPPPAVNGRATSRRPRGNQAGVLGPYSHTTDRDARGTISGNTREGRFLAAYEAQLEEHVGGNPSIVQRALITRAARLALHLELMDERSLAGDHEFTTHDHLHYVSWSNALARLLVRIGLQPAAKSDPGAPLREHLAARTAADSEAA